MAKTAGALQVVNNIKVTDSAGQPRRVQVKAAHDGVEP
jgi:hypothetical protein